MENTVLQSNRFWKFGIFISLIFLLFLQLVSDFIESIYTFGLLGTNIPPEIVSILFFLSPLALLFFKRRLPLRSAYALAGVVALLRAFEVAASPSLKLLASGLAVGILLVIFPIILSNLRSTPPFSPMEMGAGFLSGMVLSIFLRALGAGSDFSLLIPPASWLIAAGLLVLVVLLWREPEPPAEAAHPGKSQFLPTAALSIGFMAVLLMVYTCFASPTVLSRWTGVDYRLILLSLGIALGVFFFRLANNRVKPISRPLLLVWNAFFLLAGATAIMVNMLIFPTDPGAFPLFQMSVPFSRQLPLFVLLFLSPIMIIDMIILSGEMAARRPTTRQLAGGFAIGSFLFLLVVLGQVFTTVYDYIPVVGPWFRDGFWQVFLAGGLCMLLPLHWASETHFPGLNLPGRRIFVPLVVSALVLSVLTSVLREPFPETPEVQSPLRVVTYNLQQGYDRNGQRAYLEQLQEIKNLEPDLVGLQETDVARFTGGNSDLVRLIAEGLNMYSYYGPKTVTGTFGIALLSRYPLINPQTFYMYSQGEQTAAIMADVVVNGVPFTILVTHLGNGGPLIQQQQVLQALESKRNIIAMGDYNFRPDSEQYALTAQSLQNAWVHAGSPVIAGLDPARLIDHVFVSPSVIVRSADYILSPVSDHPGLVVEIDSRAFY